MFWISTDFFRATNYASQPRGLKRLRHGRSKEGLGPLPKINKNTIADPGARIKEAIEARRRGYVRTWSRARTGSPLWPQPLRVPGSDFAASISGSVTTGRMRDPAVKAHLAERLSCAAAVA